MAKLERRNATRTVVIAWALVAAGVCFAYWRVVAQLIHDWATNDNYSHGFLIVPIAAYIGWQQRARLAAAPSRPSWTGLSLVIAGALALGAGTLGAELFVARTSLILVLAGVIVFLEGWSRLRVLAFPLAFLVLMIPLPMIVFNEIAFPLQLLASRLGETALRVVHIPVFREGNIITLANTTLEVAEACSGIRSLVSLLTVSVVYAHFTEPRRRVQLLLILATVPIAVVTNGMRVAAIGVAAHYYGPGATEGVIHTLTGWLVFVFAFAILLLVQQVTRLLRDTVGLTVLGPRIVDVRAEEC
jgi:exosortase